MEGKETTNLSFCNYKLEEVLALLESVREYVYTKNNPEFDWENISSSLSFCGPNEAKKLWKRIAYKPHDTSSIDETEEDENSEIENSVTFKYKKRRRSQVTDLSSPYGYTNKQPSPLSYIPQSSLSYEPLTPQSPLSYLSTNANTMLDSPSSPTFKRQKLGRKDFPDYLDEEGKKRVPWSLEEDDALISGVDKFGEGNWTAIKLHTKLNRAPSQLSQHWQSLKKKSQKGEDRKSMTIRAIIARQRLIQSPTPVSTPSFTFYPPPTFASIYEGPSIIDQMINAVTQNSLREQLEEINNNNNNNSNNNNNNESEDNEKVNNEEYQNEDDPNTSCDIPPYIPIPRKL